MAKMSSPKWIANLALSAAVTAATTLSIPVNAAVAQDFSWLGCRACMGCEEEPRAMAANLELTRSTEGWHGDVAVRVQPGGRGRVARFFLDFSYHSTPNAGFVGEIDTDIDARRITVRLTRSFPEIDIQVEAHHKRSFALPLGLEPGEYELVVMERIVPDEEPETAGEFQIVEQSVLRATLEPENVSAGRLLILAPMERSNLTVSVADTADDGLRLNVRVAGTPRMQLHVTHEIDAATRSITLKIVRTWASRDVTAKVEHNAVVELGALPVGVYRVQMMVRDDRRVDDPNAEQLNTGEWTRGTSFELRALMAAR